jgi:hypothetical protein
MSQSNISISIPKWVLFVVAGVLIAIVASVATSWALTNSAQVASEASQSAKAEESKNAEAAQSQRLTRDKQVLASIPEKDVCGEALAYPKVSFVVSSDGKSATLRSPDGWQVKCITYRLGGPSSLYDQVLGTRALDGTRTARWDSWTASWTYHPDQGVNFIVQHD